jgi:hypothetical protein
MRVCACELIDRYLGDAGMVMALEQLQDIEDRNLLAGHISMLFADYQQVRLPPPGTLTSTPTHTRTTTFLVRAGHGFLPVPERWLAAFFSVLLWRRKVERQCVGLSHVSALV